MRSALPSVALCMGAPAVAAKFSMVGVCDSQFYTRVLLDMAASARASGPRAPPVGEVRILIRVMLHCCIGGACPSIRMQWHNVLVLFVPILLSLEVSAHPMEEIETYLNAQ